MSKLYFFFSFLILGFHIQAQVEIHESFNGQVIGNLVNGTTIYRTATTNEFLQVKFWVKNVSGSDKYYNIQRMRIVDVPAWSETLEWIYQFEGAGYGEPYLDTNPWNSPVWSSPLPNSDSAYLAMGMYTYSIEYLHFRYFVMEGATKVDSVDVVINQTLGVSEQLTDNNIKLFPNPAAESIQLKMEGPISNAYVVISDLNGKVFFSENMTIEKWIDVSTLTNGVYILSVFDDNKLLQNEQLVIKH